ncbi:uncharacterized protein LOC116661433 [Camelus ferus]|uniref:Uncharacterized protein LOC116661433 n=1 Tax=Camelus ferus TaxID=419612 RepID=A0A8B8SI12_CAMFR|nr:uncharacterized protein LOC116661433 [Camelus ferus]
MSSSQPDAAPWKGHFLHFRAGVSLNAGVILRPPPTVIASLPGRTAPFTLVVSPEAVASILRTLATPPGLSGKLRTGAYLSDDDICGLRAGQRQTRGRLGCRVRRKLVEGASAPQTRCKQEDQTDGRHVLEPVEFKVRSPFYPQCTCISQGKPACPSTVTFLAADKEMEATQDGIRAVILDFSVAPSGKGVYRRQEFKGETHTSEKQRSWQIFPEAPCRCPWAYLADAPFTRWLEGLSCGHRLKRQRAHTQESLEGETPPQPSL